MGRSKDTPGPPMTLGNMRELGVKLGLIAALFRGRYPPDGGREPKNAANSNARKLLIWNLLLKAAHSGVGLRPHTRLTS
jgi:hypothetical protein